MSDAGWTSHLGVLVLMAVVPFLVVVGTSFAKVSIVLSITRNAIGGQSVIPVSVITALSVVVTFFIMGPVVDEMLAVSLPAPTPDDADERSVFSEAAAVYDAVSPPLLNFLSANANEDEVAFFAELNQEKAPSARSARVLLLAFATSELLEALALGILVLIPFLLVDLIAANTLAALGLGNIPVLTVALPLKLLLFIASDGWHLLVNALIVSYKFA